MADLKILWDNYGFVGVLVYIVLVQLWPYLRDKIFPEQIKDRRAQAEWQRKLDERMVVAMEGMNKALISQNEKLNQVITMNIEHGREMTEALIQMAQVRQPKKVTRKAMK
jgi:hypothetical protein